MSEAPGPPSSAQPASGASTADMQRVTDMAIRLGALALIVAWCLQILAPFLGIVIWALIIAIAAGSPFERLVQVCGGRRGLAATLALTATLVVLAIPTVMLSETLAVGAKSFATDLLDGRVDVPPPPAQIADWPLVGERIFQAWSLASNNLPEALARVHPQLEAISKWLLRATASAGAGILQLLAALVIAGFMLARSSGREDTIRRFASRLAGGQRGPELAQLANATVQSVVQGILGVAVIQALLAGLGFMVAGIAAAGLWALLVLVAAIVQLPVALVMIPPILLSFYSLSTPAAAAFTVWCVVVALLDNVLKPIFFGRGVQVPTLVIFLGSIGGMLTMGIVGLFLGAVILALGYTLFQAWLQESNGSTMGEEVPGP